jgi:hypothetical protein
VVIQSSLRFEQLGPALGFGKVSTVGFSMDSSLLLETRKMIRHVPGPLLLAASACC